MQHVSHLLEAYLDGELSSRRRCQVADHLNECPVCRAELSRLERLSGLLAAYAPPDSLADGRRFSGELMLRLPRRRPRAPALPAWSYVTPLVLLCVLTGVLLLSAAPSIVWIARSLLDWAGVLVPLWLQAPTGAGLPGALDVLTGEVSRAVWIACLYGVLLALSGAYWGWVSALWRTQTRLASQKER